MDAAGSHARRGSTAGARGNGGGADAPGGARPRPRGPPGGLGARPADVDGLPRPRRLPGAREGERPGQARQGRRGAARCSTSRSTRTRSAACSSIALHPKFKKNGWVYLFWSQSRTGADSTTGDGVRLMGNRVDRFEWDHGQLEFDRNIIKFRAFQADANQPLRGNHDGGVIRFGPDGKLYAIVGDTGRRGQHAEPAPTGRSAAGIVDDQFGGPETDDLHRTGVIVRLDDDGDAPRDNPFWRTGRTMGGEVGENVQKLFAYGIRNSFGMAFDPKSGDLWEQENGDDSFSELNRVRPGMNSGWVQVMGPIVARRAVQGDRDRHDGAAARHPERLLRPPADPLAADQHRRHAGRGAGSHVHAPGRVLQRPGAELEVRGRPRRHRVPRLRRPRARATRTTCSWAARATCSRAATCSAST